MTEHYNNGNLISRVRMNYTYDNNGYRIKKKKKSGLFNSISYTYYFWEGDRLIKERKGVTDTWYLYDAAGDVVGMKYNDNYYYYVKNTLNDVVGIVDAAGALLVSYTYDSWGDVISTDPVNSLGGTIGLANPIRYRSYYYDTETGLYYLNSRYYDPETGRFISPDQIIGNGNLYAYCNNDPINYTDESGYWPTWDDIKDGANRVAEFLLNAWRKQSTAQTSHSNNVVAPISDEIDSIVENFENQVFYVDISIGFFAKGGVTFVFGPKLDYVEIYPHLGIVLGYDANISLGIIPSYSKKGDYCKWFVGGSATGPYVGAECAYNPIYFMENEKEMYSYGINIGMPGGCMDVSWYFNPLTISWE